MLDPLEQGAVIECLHLTYRKLGFRTVDVIADLLVTNLPTIAKQKAVDALAGKPVSTEARKALAERGLELIATREAEFFAALADLSPHSLTYLRTVLNTSRGVPTREGGEPGSPTQNWMWSNWIQSAKKQEPQQFWRGAFQMVRRYKPAIDPAPPGDGAPPVEEREIVVHELVFVDADKNETVLITSEGNIYRGSFMVNHEHIITNFYHRIVGTGGVNQRLLTMKLEETDLPLYSGICVKAGDTSKLPLASDVLLIPIPEKDHPEFHAEFKTWSNASPQDQGAFITKELMLWDYLSDTPPNRPPHEAAWARVAYLDEIKELRALAAPNHRGVTHFSEPTRAIDVKDLAAIARTKPPKVFRHSTRKTQAEDAANSE